MTTVITSTVGWALLATLVVLIPGLPLAYLLARKEFAGKRVVLALVSLPMVLPPTAVGYLLLRLFADTGPLRALGLDLDVLFTGKAVVVACAVMASPLIVRTAKVAFEAVDPKLESMGESLGYSSLEAFARITLPLALRGIMAAAILGFSRALGEFGATVMIAGNIPGRTQTLASAIYSAQQAGAVEKTNLLLLVAMAVGFSAVLISEHLTRQPLANRTHHGQSAGN
ncbi:MAG: molybdate ABC transporter permease subunit [Verrucomicrobiota bacterium JB022]|nr:molybdate ABC transporter permease subunit [Verrucomicrobiota bacterium JB022]